MPSFALSEITRLASIPLSFTENRWVLTGMMVTRGPAAAVAVPGDGLYHVQVRFIRRRRG